MPAGQICREKYYSYGSYLRSRGYDKEICNLVAAIENGEIQLGAITSYGTCGALINGTTTIQPCSAEGTYSAGTLRVTGGSDDTPSNFSITANHGMNLLGPVFQNYGTDVSYAVGSNIYHGNYFSMPEHVFTSNDSSTNVYIRGNLFVSGSTTDLSSQTILESLTIETFTGFDGNSLRIFHSPGAIGSVVRIDTDISSVVNGGDWERYLAFAIDSSDNTAGGTDTHGHVRALRGVTVMNPPALNTAIDISYDMDLVGTDKALDVYGGVYIQPGTNSADAKIDLSGGDFFVREGANITAEILSSGDASMSSLYVNDLSAVNAQIDTLLPSAPNAYGINYQSISSPLRSRHVFGEDIMLGVISPQAYSFTTSYGSFFVKVSPSDLRINTFNDASMLIIDTSFAGQYLALDVSNNKEQYYNSIIEFNAAMDISSSNLDKVDQTVFFLHPGPILALPNSYYPSPSKGDIIIDTRTLESSAGLNRETLVYGSRRFYIGTTIPSTLTDVSGSIYVPHLACALQNSGPTIHLNGGNISMNQRVLL